MQNELCRIGQLIYDLRRKACFNPGQENFDFLDREFARITLCLGVEWDKKVSGLPYLLEFHKEETVRLSNLVDDLIIEAALRSRVYEFLDKVYRELSNHFIELLRRIDLMIVNTSYNLN
ncbi:hypothetical protein [Pedobacter ginsengisoli]|uniref:hypothetical protein n=1 Tax=Pedobacter ginsengisoli TaxID=363852 RepID=UPI00254FE923|nr:hypothetical protein [Pedobacter ginsengisoli]